MSYGAVILYYRLGAEVFETVSTLLAQSRPPIAIVIVDNNSDDGVLQAMSGEYDGVVKVLNLSTNVGYSRGMAAGVESLPRGLEYCLLMTHEVRLAEQCVERMLDAMVADTSIAQTGPLVSSPNGEVWSAGGRLDWRGRALHRVVRPGNELVNADWLEGCCTMVRRDAINDVFDDRFFLYWDDVDISLQLSMKGTIRVVSTAHAEQKTLSAPIYFAVRNRILLWRKYGRGAKVFMASVEGAVKILLDTARGRRDQRVARLAGLRDGFNGALRLEYSSTREHDLASSPR
ncbi:glycosyltransferase family 2 protein [Microbacterium telephonicum]|uniref:GT2 family glycosyltransferase n=1 Tax=Microbacterium telephonicum TaxID=1714841 RepID=A0A498C6M0_9MICO|nr:glycosyltransferase family 2 protein [Microbacterium telephonicum]RLK47971.1 GT2 family glycosyltransferase [Microbacterium telephonicum]